MNFIDIIFVLAWGSGALVGLVAGFMRVWIPLAFLFAGMGMGGGLGLLIGPRIFLFVDAENGQVALGFFLVFFLMLLMGGAIALMMRGPLSLASAVLVLVPLGGVMNRLGGLLGGALFAGILISVVLIGLQQIPVESIAEAIEDSTFTSTPIKVVDFFVASIEINEDW